MVELYIYILCSRSTAQQRKRKYLIAFTRQQGSVGPTSCFGFLEAHFNIFYLFNRNDDTVADNEAKWTTGVRVPARTSSTRLVNRHIARARERTNQDELGSFYTGVSTRHIKRRR